MPRPFEPELEIHELKCALPNYEFDIRLGGGGQASVFKAARGDNLMDVAVKIYSPHNLIKRAEMEVEKLQRARSYHLATVVESGDCRLRGLDCYYVITEFSKGSDLREVLDNRVLLVDEVVTLMKNMLTAIEELWNLRVVHCDLKPANILYLEDGSFRLIDLGYAKHLDIESMTAMGTIFGTSGYMAPEQWLGRRSVTLRADLFALGIISYEALTGRHPFNRNQLLINKLTSPPPVETLTSIEDKIAKAINWLVQPMVLKRPSSCKQVLDLLEEV